MQQRCGWCRQSFEDGEVVTKKNELTFHLDCFEFYRRYCRAVKEACEKEMRRGYG